MKSKRAVLFRREDNWRCPLGLRWFNDFQLDHLGDLILLELARFESSSIWGELDWMRVLQI